MNRIALLTILIAVLAASTGFAGQDKQPAPVSTVAPLAASESTRATGTQEELDRPVLKRRNARYQIAKTDQLDLDFPLTPEFNQTVIVQPDGYITLRGVGDVHIEGLTIPELVKTLRVAYSKILHEPIITAGLKDFEKPYFVAGGEVGHPGKYDLRGDTTVVQAVAIAGGFNENAKPSQVLLLRRVSNDWVEVKKLNVKALLRAENLQEDLHLRSGDMLFVPKTAMSQIKRFIPTASMGMFFNPFQLR